VEILVLMEVTGDQKTLAFDVLTDVPLVVMLISVINVPQDFIYSKESVLELVQLTTTETAKMEFVNLVTNPARNVSKHLTMIVSIVKTATSGIIKAV